MTQTFAIFLDAYRELNARKLFWLTLALSLLVVVVFGMIGLTPTGLKIVFWDLDSQFINSKMIKPDVFYKGIYTGFGVKFWLTWVAAILALVSTAGIFPELITSGSIDLVLSKPLGRLRLFITKFFAGLLFVALQVSVFSVACFFVIGVRGGVWEPGLLLAIPLVLCFFSYLFAIVVLLGMLTRSTIASLLLTLLIWFAIFALHGGETVVLMGRLTADQRVESVQKDITRYQAVLAQPPDDSTGGALRRSNAEKRLNELPAELAETQASQRNWTRVHDLVFAFKTILPKTSETVELLERWLIAVADLPEPPEDAADQPGPFGGSRVDRARLQKQMTDEIRGRSVFWVLGTSLGFEAVVLGLAAFIFCRRDY